MRLRDARPDDAVAVAGVHVRSWQDGYRGLLPDEYLDSLRAEDRAARYDFSGGSNGALTIVALDGHTVVGFATVGEPFVEGGAGIGELQALYVDTPYWRRGIGRALIEEARARLRSLGSTRAQLWVLAGNARAMRFYESDGWIASGMRRMQRIWGIDVDEIGYERALD